MQQNLAYDNKDIKIPGSVGEIKITHITTLTKAAAKINSISFVTLSSLLHIHFNNKKLSNSLLFIVEEERESPLQTPRSEQC